jgi:hypothetical protein
VAFIAFCDETLQMQHLHMKVIFNYLAAMLVEFLICPFIGPVRGTLQELADKSSHHGDVTFTADEVL